MCFGTKIICGRCERPTVYLLPGIHRCRTRCKASHLITGPTSTTKSCWACRPTIPGSINEVKEVVFWSHSAEIFIGYADSLEESKANIDALTSEIEEASDESVKKELEELKRAEELRARDFEAVADRFTEWKKGRNFPIHVIAPPAVDKAKPLTFKEWTSKFGVEAREFDGKKALTAWEALDFHDCDDHELYLEENDFEYELDLFRAQNNELRYMDRRLFEFDPNKLQALDEHAEEPKGLLSWADWKRKGRLGAIKWSEERIKAKSTAERFERDLNLYAVYLEDALHYWSEILGHFRTHHALRRRKRLNEEYQFIWGPHREEENLDATEAPPAANDEEHTGGRRWLRTASRWIRDACRLPANDGEATEEATAVEVKQENVPAMTFAEWCASPLAPQDAEVNKNTDTALRADLKGYVNYCSTFPHPMPEEHCATRRRLEVFRAKTFDYTPLQEPTPTGEQTGSPWPLSLSDFRQFLVGTCYTEGKPSINCGWAEDAYVLYLRMFAGQEAVGGFGLLRDWWARDDRRELEGLPRCDPLIRDLKSVMRRIVQYIGSMEDPQYRLAVEGCLRPVILMLNSCMEEHRALTREQWEYVRATYHHAEAVAEVVRARVQGRAAEVTRVGVRQPLIAAADDYSGYESETDSEDGDDHLHIPHLRSGEYSDDYSDDEGLDDEDSDNEESGDEDSDDEGSDDAGAEFPIIRVLAALMDDAEETDDDE